MSLGTPFKRGCGTPTVGMQFYVSRDYIHLGAISPRMSPLLGDILSSSFRGICLLTTPNGDMSLGTW